jgi:hypothetical protein
MNSSTKTPGDVTYSAHIGVNDVGTGIEMIVRRAVRAGIDGPFGHYELVDVDLAEAGALLWRDGFRLVGSWNFIKAYDGLRLEAELEKMEG